MFTPAELDQLRSRFSGIDTNADGLIPSKSLEAAIRGLGFPNVPDDTIEHLIAGSSDIVASGSVDLTEFLDIAAAAKEVSLSNKLNRYMAGETDEADPKKATMGSSSRQSKDGGQTWIAWWKRRIPVERSGGGT